MRLLTQTGLGWFERERSVITPRYQSLTGGNSCFAGFISVSMAELPHLMRDDLAWTGNPRRKAGLAKPARQGSCKLHYHK